MAALMVTVLQMIQGVAARLQLPIPSAVNGSTDANVILMTAMLNQTLQDLQREFAWPELQRQYTFTLATGVASYAIPLDMDQFQSATFWNRTQRWPLIGPIDSVLWQQYKSGLITTFPRQRIRVVGWSNNQMFIDPTPSSDQNGETCVYEYISKTTIAPREWVASTSWTGNASCAYNGNIYYRGSTAAATTGTTPPTWTSGSASDGSITWEYSDGAYNSTTINQNDTDRIILDPASVEDGTVWRFKQERGLDYEDLRNQALEQLGITKARLLGAGVINVSRTDNYPGLIGVWSYPEGNFNI